MDTVVCMAFPEAFIFLRGGKQRFHPLHFEFHFDFPREPGCDFLHGHGYLILCVHGGADGGKQMGMPGINNMFFIQL